MNDEEEKKEIQYCKVTVLNWSKKNWPTIIAILISLVAVGVSNQANINSNQANEIASEALYNSTHADEIHAKNIEGNTCIETTIFVYPEAEHNRTENINIFLHNSMLTALNDVEYVIRTPDHTRIQNISYDIFFEGHPDAVNNSYLIFVWRHAINVNKTALLSFNLTWNTNDVPLDSIGNENISFQHDAGGIPITNVENNIFWNQTEFQAYQPHINGGCKSTQ